MVCRHMDDRNELTVITFNDETRTFQCTQCKNIFNLDMIDKVTSENYTDAIEQLRILGDPKRKYTTTNIDMIEKLYDDIIRKPFSNKRRRAK